MRTGTRNRSIGFYVELFKSPSLKDFYEDKENVANGIIVRDDIEIGYGIVIPLWMF